jgi:hypothetical protein
MHNRVDKMKKIKIECFIYQIERNFEENPDLKTVFAYLLHGTCNCYFNAEDEEEMV